MGTVATFGALLLFSAGGFFGQATQPVAAPATGTAAATKPAAEPQKLSPVVKPRVLHKEDSAYTQDAWDHHITGKIEVYLKVDVNGDPTHILVVRGLGYGLDMEAIKATRLYKFQPATRDGVPVPVDLYIEFDYAGYKHR